jgi:hypothetical protein
LPAVDASLGPDVVVLRLAPSSLGPTSLSWLFTRSDWFDHDDGSVSRGNLKYALTMLRNHLDPDLRYHHAVLSSAPLVKFKGHGAKASAHAAPPPASRPSGQAAQVNAASLASPSSVAPAAPLASSGAGAGGSADGALAQLLVGFASLRQELSDTRKELAAQQQHQQQLSAQLARHPNRAFAGQGAPVGQALVPHANSSHGDSQLAQLPWADPNSSY